MAFNLNHTLGIFRIVSFISRCASSTLCVPDYISEDAVEYDELDTFLRLKETWNVADEDHPAPPVQPIGVPGAASPLQMTPDHLKSHVLAQSPSPLKGRGVPVNKREGEFDVSTELSGYGLQGVRVTDDELRDLVAELGLDGDEAGDLVKGLSAESPTKEEPKLKALDLAQGKDSDDEAKPQDTHSPVISGEKDEN